MPEKKTIERAAAKKRRGAAPSTQAGEFVREEVEHVKEGKHGVKSPKQAIAIGLSKARRAGVAVPPKPGAKTGSGRAKTASTRGATKTATGRAQAASTRSSAKTTARAGGRKSAASRTAANRSTKPRAGAAKTGAAKTGAAGRSRAGTAQSRTGAARTSRTSSRRTAKGPSRPAR